MKPNAVAVNSMLAACARDASDFWMHANTLFEVWSFVPCASVLLLTIDVGILCVQSNHPQVCFLIPESLHPIGALVEDVNSRWHGVEQPFLSIVHIYFPVVSPVCCCSFALWF